MQLIVYYVIFMIAGDLAAYARLQQLWCLDALRQTPEGLSRGVTRIRTSGSSSRRTSGLAARAENMARCGPFSV
jgi:hypothetical protein